MDIKKRFVVELNNNTAYVEYIENESLLEVTHTQVPPELSGQGIASQLVKYAFDYAQSKGLLFAPSCPYAQTWLARTHFKSSPKEL